MSVSITGAYHPTDYVVACACPEAQAVAPKHPTHAAASETYPAEPLRVELPGCEYPGRCRPMVIGLDSLLEDAPEVNPSNANARRVLETLGLYSDNDDELSGSCSAEDFLGRVLLAQAITPADPGIPAVQDGNNIDCGRAAGYLQDTLAALRELADWCIANDRKVTWG